VREKTTTRILKDHRIHRFGAAHVLSELRKPALAVAPGTIEAATARIHGLIERIRLRCRAATRPALQNAL
jgi:hypothetical protein